ncbi:uncharacterized protein [Dermacentor albipictus]|uniref:uncharacterized protein n=1 Tax=Dermacentor albipictus TaxID=60249 RepID=UPI0031FCEDC8
MFQRKRLRCRTMEQPQVQVRRVLRRQLPQPVPVGQPTLFEPALPLEHTEPSPGEPRHVGMSSPDNGYFFLAERPIWNEFPSFINIELREVRPGELAMACLRSRLVSDVSNMQHRYLFGLVHWLLMKHCCIKFVEPSESHVTHNHFLLLRDFWLSRNLGNVKLSSYRSDDYLPRGLFDGLRSAVTTLDTLELMSMRFFGLQMLCEMLGRRRSSDLLREYAAYLLGRWPILCLPVNQLFWNLRYLRSILSHRRVNHDDCRTASEANVCFLLVELSLWNELLRVNFELRAVSAARLVLTCPNGRVVSTFSNRQRRNSFVGVHMVLTEQCTNNFLELCEPRISQNHFLFRDGLHISRYMWYINLPGYLAETLYQSVTTHDRLDGMHMASRISACRHCTSYSSACALLSRELDPRARDRDTVGR